MLYQFTIYMLKNGEKIQTYMTFRSAEWDVSVSNDKVSVSRAFWQNDYFMFHIPLLPLSEFQEKHSVAFLSCWNPRGILPLPPALGRNLRGGNSLPFSVNKSSSVAKWCYLWQRLCTKDTCQYCHYFMNVSNFYGLWHDTHPCRAFTRRRPSPLRLLVRQWIHCKMTNGLLGITCFLIFKNYNSCVSHKGLSWYKVHDTGMLTSNHANSRSQKIGRGGGTRIS